MPSYTHMNLKDVEDAAPKAGMSPDMEARFAGGALELADSRISYQRVASGARSPFGHRHKTQEELYVVIEGGGRMKLDDDIIELKALDAVRVAPETTRGFEGGPDGLTILAFGAPPTEGRDGVIEQDWWTD